EAQEKDISPTTMEAARTLAQVAFEGVRTYKRRTKLTDKGKNINTGLDDEAAINTSSSQVKPGSANLNADKGQREGKAPITVEEVQDIKKTKIHMDKMVAKRLQEEIELSEREMELSEKQKKRKEQVQFEAQYYTKEDWDAIRANIEANADLTKDMLGKNLPEEDFAKRIVEMINKKKKYYAEQKAKAKRSKPMTQEQQREYMSTFIKNQSSWKLTQLKKLTFEELKNEFEKLVKNIERFVPIESNERVKRQGVQLEQEFTKKQKIIEDAPKEKVEGVKEEEIEKPVKKKGKRRKQLARKGKQIDKTDQSGTEE
ncbi:hypothetical protein Tco_1420214, partial [Tanacetum coccineum]